MPRAKQPPELPVGFDPDKHCGATRRNKGVACMLVKGQNTDHPGVGKCYLHGGRTPIRGDGSRSIQLPKDKRLMTFDERVNAALKSPDLLSLDQQIAQVKVILAIQNEQTAKIFDQTLKAIDEGLFEDENDIPQIYTPDIDTAALETLNRLVRTAYEMKFSKRFSIPVTEVQRILLGVRDAFFAMAMKYNLPQEAKLEFAQRLRSLKVQAPAEDPQLLYAGGQRPQLIEGDARPLP